MEILKDKEKIEVLLTKAYIPEEIWDKCIVLENGMIFTDEENFKSWLSNVTKEIKEEVKETVKENIDAVVQEGKAN